MMKHSDTREIVAGCPNPPAAAVAGYGGIRWWSYCRYEKPSIWASAERLL